MLPLLNVGAAAALVTGVLFAWRDPLSGMVQQWSATPMYSYAYTVPVISLYLLWSRRNDFARQTPEPARLIALPILALAASMLVVGRIGAIQVVQQLGFLVTIAGMVLFLFGAAYLRISSPALAYLLFMIPLWDVFTERLHEPFQYTSAMLGVKLLRSVGVPVYLDGTLIALPNIVLEVARACSGVNYLVAVLALALPLAFLRLSSTKPRLMLIGGSVLIAALANGLRVALIGVLAYYEVGSPLHGPFHVLHGLFVAAVGYLALFAGLRFLESRDRMVDIRPQPGEAVNTTAWELRDAGSLAVLFWVVGLLAAGPHGRPVLLAKPLDTLPYELGDWTAGPPAAHVSHVTTAAWDEADQRLRRQYRRLDGPIATVAIWYFEAQQQNREMVSSRVDELHRRSTRRAIPLPRGGRLDANMVRWPDREAFGLFWYELGGSVASNRYFAKVRTLWNVLTEGRSNGAAIMVTSPAQTLPDDNTIAAIENLAAELHLALASVWSSPRVADISSLSSRAETLP